MKNGASGGWRNRVRVGARTALYGETASSELCIDMDGSTSSGSDGSLAQLAGPVLSVPRDQSRGPRTEEIIAATTAVHPPG